MVATRRGTVIEPAAEPGEPPAQKTSAELGTPVPQRQTRGTKISEVGHDEFQLEDLHAAETLHVVDTSEPLNLSLKAASKNRSRAEPQSDGEVSEAESTCSTLSGLQTPSITRTTRRRQIIINCQTDSIQRNRSRKSVSTARPISESQEETEVSEAESNCSSFSGIHLSNISRRVSSRQNINRFPLTVANECQPEEVSDAESCCSGISASQAANRVTRSRIAKAQAETIRQTQDLTREFTPECQTLPKNKPEDVSDAESWCSGIAAGPPVRRLTRNSLARSHARTESQPIASSELGSVEKAASDTEQTSVVSTRVLRNLRSRQPSQRQEELQSQSEVDSKSGGLKQDETPSSSNVAEKSQTRAITLNKPPPLWYKGEADHGEERSSKAAQLEDVAAQPEHEDPEGSPANQNKSPKKGSKTILEPQQMNKKFKLTIDSDVDDCEITKVIEADSDDTDQINEDLKSRAQRNAELKKFTAKQTSVLEKDDCSMVFLSSGGEVSDTSSEDESDVSLVESVTQKPALAQPSEDMRDTPGNELFIIDTAPGLDTNKKYYIEQDQETHDVESAEEEFQEEDPSHGKTDDDNDFIDEDENEALLREPKPGFVLSTAIDTGLNIKDIGGLYISFDAEKQRPKGSALKVKKKEEQLKRSVITPDFEKRESVPPYSESVQRLKKKRKEERDKTTGDGWFGMRAPELTDELKNDLKALKMRSAIDPKRFYKKNDREGFPKYFQVGTVVDSAVDFYHSRIPKKQRKKTIVEELLADSDFRRYNKKKYRQIMAEKAALAAGKKNRKKKAFRT